MPLFSSLFLLALLTQSALTAKYREGTCVFALGIDWSADCTAVYVEVKNAETNDTVAIAALLTATPSDSRTADVETVKATVTTMVEQYKESEMTKRKLDLIQTSLMCCGAEGIDDWDMNEHFSCSATNSNDKCGVPYTCCKEQSPLCGKMVRNRDRHPEDPSEELYTTGCAGEVAKRSMCFKEKKAEGEKSKKSFIPAEVDSFTCYYDSDQDPVQRAYLSSAPIASVSTVLFIAISLRALF